MKVTSLGEMLRAARLRHHLEIELVSARTKIPADFLIALEENNFDQLPAAVFVRGFVRAYSQLLGLDPEVTVSLLRRDYTETSSGHLLPQPNHLGFSLRHRRRLPTYVWAVISAGVVVLVLGSYVAFRWFQLTQPPEIILTEPAPASVAAARVRVTGATHPEASLSINGAPVSLQPDGSFSTEISFATEGIALIRVVARDQQGRERQLDRTISIDF